jgi:hypothetical protein
MMTSREKKRLNGDCRGTVSSQRSADIKGSPEFFVECNWRTLDYNTRLFGPGPERQRERERELSWNGGCAATCTARIVVRFLAYRLALRPAEPPLDNRYIVERPERETDESLATSDDVRNIWGSSSTFNMLSRRANG